VIQERHDNLVPARKAAVSLHGDEVGQPGDVLDLLFLQFEVGVEAAVVELLLESHREFPDRFLQHNLVQSFSTGLNLVLSSVLLHVREHLVIVGALNGSLDLLQVVSLVKHLVPLRVKVADLADVLFTLAVGHSSITLAHLSVVLDDLNGLQVRLELEQVAHDAR
jgi:hypothetical protein